MRVKSNLLAKVRSSFQLTRLTYALTGKKAQTKHELFSDHYHEEYCRFEQLANGEYAVESKDKGLFGVRGGLPNFILDWLKLSFHRGNEAYLQFLSYFEHRLVELRHKKADMSSIIFRAEKVSDEQQKQALKNQYLAPINFDFSPFNLVPSTLLNRHANRSIVNIHRMLGYYFPYKFEIVTDNIEWKIIPPESRSRLGRTQLGKGLILGEKHPQLGHKVTVIVHAKSAEQFQQFYITNSDATNHLRLIKNFCRKSFTDHACVDVVAQYNGERVNPREITKDLSKAMVLGSNVQLLSKNNIQQQQVRKH